MTSTVTFEYNKNSAYTLTLWRDEKKTVHELKDVSRVDVDGVDEECISPEDRVRINGPACEGVFYYICAEHYNGEYSMFWISREEADFLTPILDSIKEERYYKEFEYEFTRTAINDCIKNPTKYGPEQRARMLGYCPDCKEGLAGSVYRPHCSVCPWDSENDECDYCHGAVGRCGGHCRDND